MMAIHFEGGIQYMVPLTLMFLFMLVMVVIELVQKFRTGTTSARRTDFVKQIGLLALAWGTLSTLIGFFYAFGDLSRSGDTIPFNDIMGGLRVALITVLYGAIIYVVSLFCLLLLR